MSIQKLSSFYLLVARHNLYQETSPDHILSQDFAGFE
jgi:hypothetical protein